MKLFLKLAALGSLLPLLVACAPSYGETTSTSASSSQAGTGGASSSSSSAGGGGGGASPVSSLDAILNEVRMDPAAALA